MKLLNIFKKETKKTANVNIQKMDKNQLNKVIGGADVSYNNRTVGAGQVTEIIK